MKFRTTLRLSDVSLRRPFFQSLISLWNLSRLDRDFSMLDMCLRQIYKLLKCQSQQRSQFSVREQEKKKVVFPTQKFMALVRRSSKVCSTLEWGQEVLQVAGAGGAFCWILLFQQGKIHPNFSNLGVSGTLPLHMCSGLCSLCVCCCSDECIPTKRAPWNWAHLHWASELDLKQGLHRQRRMFQALTVAVPHMRGEAVSILCLQKPILVLLGRSAPAYLRHFSLNMKEMKTALLAAESPYRTSRLTERS